MTENPTDHQTDQTVQEVPAEQDVQEPAARRSGRHPVNVAHLVMGIAFLGLCLAWALISSDVVEGDDVRWLLPVPWLLAGGAGLVAIVVRAARRP